MTARTDRELLELAAKAAGLKFSYQSEIARVSDGEAWWDWNPRHDDGDSRRLQVKLGIHITNSQTHAWASTLLFDATVPFEKDPCDATRLAVLRVAAEVGAAL